ncbi:MAG: efflux RND transporter periplasmic adaptor subunit [Nitrospirae bacterium]|nr:efflux RND transporter periplasmic adaptor subunit [Nitrospirota bacterium]MDA1305193.1 efflux RND transporter periplasmic adaptor subunit [Nitrospirota bacterium]
MKRGWIIFVLAIVAIGGGVYWFFPMPWAQQNQQEKEAPRVIVVERSTLKTRVSETGTLAPIRTLDIKSQFSGEVLKIFIREGESVVREQPLMVIRQEPSQARQVAQLRAKLEQEGINVAQARRNFVRREGLHAKGFVARQDLETAEQEAQQAMVRRELAEKELLLALGGNQELFQRYISQDPTQTGLEEFRVASPSDGTIIDISVQPGEIITSGTATVGGGSVLMKLADLRKMVAQAKINEVNIHRVRTGQPVMVRLDAIPGEEFEGVVTAIAPQGEKTESIVTYEVTIQIDNKELSLRPMMTANVDILTEDLADVIAVPLETLQSEQGDDVVYVQEGEEQVRRKVRVAFRTPTQAVVTQGLEAGDRLVVPSFKKGRQR